MQPRRDQFGKKCPVNFAALSILANIRAGPRINADDVAPSYGLFLTCRGENMYIII
jgi:hypothetical protein